MRNNYSWKAEETDVCYIWKIMYSNVSWTVGRYVVHSLFFSTTGDTFQLSLDVCFQRAVFFWIFALTLLKDLAFAIYNILIVLSHSNVLVLFGLRYCPIMLKHSVDSLQHTYANEKNKPCPCKLLHTPFTDLERMEGWGNLNQLESSSGPDSTTGINHQRNHLFWSQVKVMWTLIQIQDFYFSVCVK